MNEITTDNGTRVVRGQLWREDDGYHVRVVGFFANGWPAVRHVNAKNGSSPVNPAWFDHWTLTRDVETPDSPTDAQDRPVRRLPQQLDLDGTLHDLAPQSERMRLFEPAPRQIDGQTGLNIDA